MSNIKACQLQNYSKNNIKEKNLKKICNNRRLYWPLCLKLFKINNKTLIQMIMIQMMMTLIQKLEYVLIINRDFVTRVKIVNILTT